MKINVYWKLNIFTKVCNFQIAKVKRPMLKYGKVTDFASEGNGKF